LGVFLWPIETMETCQKKKTLIKKCLSTLKDIHFIRKKKKKKKKKKEKKERKKEKRKKKKRKEKEEEEEEAACQER
jgi:hypothetical protein